MTAPEGASKSTPPPHRFVVTGKLTALGLLLVSLASACSSDSPTTGGAGGTGAGGAAPATGGTGNLGGSTGTVGTAGSSTIAGSSSTAGSAGSDSVGGSSGGGETGAGTGGGGTSAGTAGASAGSGGAAAGSGGASGGTGGGGPAGCPAAATFCDNFDASADLGSAWTMDNTLGATIKVVNTFTTTPGPTMAHSGANAVQVSFTTGKGYGMIVSKMGFPAPPAAAGYWGRVWLYVETPTTDTGHDVYIEGSTGTNLSNNGARPLNTQGNMSINVDPVGTGEASAQAKTGIPRGAWTCFEWQISATGGSGDVNLYVGGVMAAAASLKATAIQALVEQRIGYERYAAGVAGNLWIDDYAIGTARLGCM